MEENRKKIKDMAKVVGIFTIGVLAGYCVYKEGRKDQLNSDVEDLTALGNIGLIKLEIPEIAETTTWKNIYD